MPAWAAFVIHCFGPGDPPAVALARSRVRLSAASRRPSRPRARSAQTRPGARPAPVAERTAPSARRVPKARIGSVTALVCTATVTPTPASARESSSSTRMYERKSAPAPPYSSGTQAPIRPSSASFAKSSRGKRCSRSHSEACGSISASANSRVSAWISRCSARQLEVHRRLIAQRAARRGGAGSDYAETKRRWIARRRGSASRNASHDVRVELALGLADDLGAGVVPVQRRRYGRSLVIASSASATAKTRAPSGMSVPHEPVGIAVAVPALVVVADDLQALALQQRDAAEHLLAQHRVRLHQAPLARRSAGPACGGSSSGIADLADVVEQEAVLRCRCRRRARGSHLAGELHRVALHALRVLAGAGVLRLERGGERADGLAVGALEQHAAGRVRSRAGGGGRARRASAAPRLAPLLGCSGAALAAAARRSTIARSSSGLKGLRSSASAPASRAAAGAVIGPGSSTTADRPRRAARLELRGRTRARPCPASARRGRSRRANGSPASPRAASVGLGDVDRRRPRRSSGAAPEGRIVVDEQDAHGRPSSHGKSSVLAAAAESSARSARRPWPKGASFARFRPLRRDPAEVPLARVVVEAAPALPPQAAGLRRAGAAAGRARTSGRRGRRAAPP